MQNRGFAVFLVNEGAEFARLSNPACPYKFVQSMNIVSFISML